MEASHSGKVAVVPPKAEKAAPFKSMWITYIIQSTTTKRYYIGFTSDIDQRLRQHNLGANRSTRHKGPWKLIYSETYSEKSLAWDRERQIKSYKGGMAFKKLIQLSIVDGSVA